jgi:hypothetical protein
MSYDNSNEQKGMNVEKKSEGERKSGRVMNVDMNMKREE